MIPRYCWTLIRKVKHAKILINNIFSAISEWMSKRECIIFGHKTRLNTVNNFKYVKLDNFSKIYFVDKIKDLGIIFDQHLTMETQILNVRAKAIGNLINISRISKYIDKNSRLKLVYGLVLSRVDFCNSLYANLPKYQIRELQIIISDAARLVCNVVRFSDKGSQKKGTAFMWVCRWGDSCEVGSHKGKHVLERLIR